MNLSELISLVERTCRVIVSIETISPLLRECKDLQILPDQHLHHSAVCKEFKLSRALQTCIRNKFRSLEVARRGKRIFSGYCPNGIWDMAVPVFYAEKLVAVVYLGGYPSRPDDEKLNDIRMYGKFIARFIILELLKASEQASVHRKRRDEQFYFSNCMRFIEEKYNKPISLADLAEKFKVNPDYLGKLLQRHFGRTFRELLCEKRMKESEILVRLHRCQTISEISRLCGFSDSNYFSVVFKKYFGMAPVPYRRKHSLPGNEDTE